MKFISGILFLLLTAHQISLGQTQLGNTILGEANGDYFGCSSDMSETGDRVVVGARFNDGGGTYSGHARVYQLNGSNWVQLGSDIDGDDSNDQFGGSVSISSDGNRIAVGARYGSSNGYYSGYVRVYDWNGTNWIQIGNTLEGNITHNQFGSSVDLSSDGSKLVVGSANGIYLPPAGASDLSQVSVFELSGNNWTQIGNSIVALDLNYNFGYSVAISDDGNRIIAGAPRSDQPFENSGSVRIFERIGNNWVIVGNIIYGDFQHAHFGASVAIDEDGSTIIVGSFPIGVVSPSGLYYAKTYEWNGSNWNQIGSAFSSTNTSGRLGSSVSISSSGEVIAIGDSNDEVVKFFTRNGNQWTQFGNTINGDNGAGSAISLSKDGTRAIIGEPAINNGEAQVFDLPENCTWTEQINGDLLGQNTGDYFGHDVELSDNGNFMVVGATWADVGGVSMGIVYVYERINDAWVQRGNPIEGSQLNGQFGRSVVISADGRFVAVGTKYNDEHGTNSGEVRIFKWDGNDYNQYGNDLNGSSSYDYFGADLAMTDNAKYIVIGIPGKGNAGGVQIYKKGFFGGYSLFNTPISGSYYNKRFGTSVAISKNGKVLAVGDDLQNTNGTSAGYVAMFKLSNNNWIRTGEIYGDAAGNYTGRSISLSEAGNVLAISDAGNDDFALNAGRVRVFYFGHNNWHQLGLSIHGSQSHMNLGSKVALSNSGLRVAIGAANADFNGSSSGAIQVHEYDKNSDSWPQVNTTFVGDHSNDYLGINLSISGDGTLVAGGANGNDNNGPIAGLVRVYKTCAANAVRQGNEEAVEESETLELVNENDLVVYPNPASEVIQINGIVGLITDIQIINPLGQTVYQTKQALTSIPISNLPNGNYFIRITLEDSIVLKQFVKE